MSLTEHTGLSEEDVRAAEVLDVLRNSHGDEILRNRSARTLHEEFKQESQEPFPQVTLLDRVRRNSIINNVMSLYEMNTKKRAASSVHLNSSESEERAQEENFDDSNALEDDEEEEDHDERQGVSKRQKITEAIAKSRGNLKEYQLNMSIGSKKRLITCLHLLKLANKQLTQKVAYLQEQVERERTNSKAGGRDAATHGNDDEEEEDDEDEYFDAAESVNDETTVINMEVVGTVKKVYSLISKFAGNSLPEPARTQVRQTLLNLPTNWSISVSNSSSSRRTKRQKKPLTANGKILILAEESLSVVRNVMNVVDCNLGKAQEWVKQKQELKEILKERFIQQQLKRQVRDQLTKERKEAENEVQSDIS
ncbi:uncharacterized protein ZBIST_3349 [Zygosaccharomyces bailii]|nr:uncharacterized protein ZBIST_3349 [Zygosaccharomyces bailii]